MTHTYILLQLLYRLLYLIIFDRSRVIIRGWNRARGVTRSMRAECGRGWGGVYSRNLGRGRVYRARKSPSGRGSIPIVGSNRVPTVARNRLSTGYSFRTRMHSL